MIRVCKICGKQFEGRSNKEICSAACRQEAKVRYMKEYRSANREKIQQKQKEWYCKQLARKPKITSSDNIALDIEPEPQPEPQPEPAPKLKPKNYIPDKFKGSSWGKKYYKALRIDKIVMLSSALSEYGIEYLSYGQLSAMFESGCYSKLLNRVLTIKVEERRENEKQA